MTLYYVHLTITTGAAGIPAKTTNVHATVEAERWTAAARLVDMWQAGVEVSASNLSVSIEGISTTKKKGTQPVPLMSRTLLLDAMRKLNLKEKANG